MFSPGEFQIVVSAKHLCLKQILNGIINRFEISLYQKIKASNLNSCKN